MFGCACALAGGAALGSQHIASLSARPVVEDATSQTQVPLFVQTAQQVEPGTAWRNRASSVAFNDEMIALLTMGANLAARPQAPELQASNEDRPPLSRHASREERRRARREERERARAERAERRAQVRAERAARNARAEYRGDRDSPDKVEVRVRDRRGTRIRTERVEPEVADRPPAPRAYAPGPFRMFGPFGD